MHTKNRKNFIIFLSLAILMLFLCLPVNGIRPMANLHADSPLEIGEATYFVITPGKKLVAWGVNDHNLISDNDIRWFPIIARRCVLDEDVSSVDLGTWYALAVTEEHELYGWGWNAWGQLNWESRGGIMAPTLLMDHVAEAAAGSFHCVARKEDGSLWTWGENGYGQLGIGTVDGDIHEPTLIMEHIKKIFSYGDTVFAIHEDGSLYCWGITKENGLCISWPNYVTDSVEAVACTTFGNYLLLTSGGQLLLYDGSTLMDTGVSGVKSILNYGFIKEDHTLWRIEASDGSITIHPVRGFVARAQGAFADRFIVAGLDGSVDICEYGGKGYLAITYMRLALCGVLIAAAIRLYRGRKALLS